MWSRVYTRRVDQYIPQIPSDVSFMTHILDVRTSSDQHSPSCFQSTHIHISCSNHISISSIGLWYTHKMQRRLMIPHIKDRISSRSDHIDQVTVHLQLLCFLGTLKIHRLKQFTLQLCVYTCTYTHTFN